MDYREKYPGSYTDHYLIMLSIQCKQFTCETFKQFAIMYRQIEGQYSLKIAIQQFDEIINSSDWEYVESIVADCDIDNFSPELFVQMTDCAKEIANLETTS